MTTSAMPGRNRSARRSTIGAVLTVVMFVVVGCAYPPAGTITTVAGSAGVGPAMNFGYAVHGVAIKGNSVYFTDRSADVVRRVDRTTGDMTVVAGTNGGDTAPPGPTSLASTLRLEDLDGMALDPQGRLVFAASGLLQRREITGVRTVVDGSYPYPTSMTSSAAGVAYVDGPEMIWLGIVGGSVKRLAPDGTQELLFDMSNAQGITIDLRAIGMLDDGTVYVAVGNQLNRIDAPGVLTPLFAPFVGAVEAMANDGNELVLVDGEGLKRVTPAGVVTNLSGPAGPLAAHATTMTSITQLDVDTDGSIVAATDWGQRVVVIDPDAGTVQQVAGGGGGGLGGLATRALLQEPTDVAAAPDGSIVVATGAGVRRFTPHGTIEAHSGNGRIRSLAFSPSGQLYYTSISRVFVRQPDGTVTNYGGNSGFSGDGGSAQFARFSNPDGLAVATNGDVVIADTMNHRVRRIRASDGVINTIAGNGTAAFAGDGGPATSASLNEPHGVAIGPDGRVYIADFRNNRVRRIEDDGIITTFAGGAVPIADVNALVGDGGPAVGAMLAGPWDLAFHDGNAYISDAGRPQSQGCNFFLGCSGKVVYPLSNANHRIRRVDPNGFITSVTGFDRNGSLVGDGGPIAQAGLFRPTGIAIRNNSALLIADSANNRVRSVNL